MVTQEERGSLLMCTVRQKHAELSVQLREHSRILWQHIQQAEWERVRESLRSPLGNKVAARTNFDGATLLSGVVGFDPPVDVVDSIISVHPKALATKNSRGRLPLHMACACGASVLVMKTLISNYPKAALEVDMDGKTPLHYAVESYYQAISTTNASKLRSSMTEPRTASFEAMSTIITASPNALWIADTVTGETPLDIANRMALTGACKSEEIMLMSCATRPSIRSQR